MTWMKRLTIFCVTLLMICSFPLTSRAADLDLERRGEIRITVEEEGEAVSGGNMAIYRVGGIHKGYGELYFEPTGGFAACGLDYSDVQSPSLARALADYAKEEEISPLETKNLGKNGTVRFSDLEPGLYLLVQKKAAEGYYKLDPFLVSLPRRVDDLEYDYEVDASPKVEPEPKPTDPTEPDEELPQTGQTNWPIPAMAISGMLLFAAGWVLCFGKRDADAK